MKFKVDEISSVIQEEIRQYQTGVGNRFVLTAWGELAVSDSVSVSARLDGQIWRNVRGADPDLNPAMVPTADPDLLRTVLPGLAIDEVPEPDWPDSVIVHQDSSHLVSRNELGPSTS